MNNVTLQGYIRDIGFSHDIGNIEYGKAHLICPGVNGREDDIISLIFKQFSNRYREGDFIEIKGNLRSHSQNLNGKNKVDIYVFTYFDIPEWPKHNYVSMDGNICKIDRVRFTKYGKKYIHFILANNIFTPNGKKLNNYIPCVIYGSLVDQFVDENYSVGDSIVVNGELHSRLYKKRFENSTFEFKVAHELVVQEVEK
jgi:hypothetical protein